MVKWLICGCKDKAAIFLAIARMIYWKLPVAPDQIGVYSHN